MIPTVAIVGRPNTGKSTLFNRLVGSKTSITFSDSGTTRDRVFARTDIGGYEVLLVDTGGLEEPSGDDVIESNIHEQSNVAINESDLIIFVVDAREALTASDFHAAELLRKSKKPVILLASKCDSSDKMASEFYNLYEFGFGHPLAISSIHDIGMDELKDFVRLNLKKLGFKSSRKRRTDSRLKICFAGKPNVGKSSILNAILGRKQVIVSDVPGTTRDSISIPFEYNEEKFTLIDTAGIRRSGKIGRRVERYSVLRSLKSIELADVVVLIIDASTGLTKQDMKVSEYILEAKKGIIIVANKIDLITDDDRKRVNNNISRRMVYMPFAPLIFTSAVHGSNLMLILEKVIEIKQERLKKIKTKELNYFMERTVGKFPPHSGVRIKFVEQVDTEPPCFVFRVKKPDLLHFSYKRYLENEIRKEFGFTGTAIQLKFIDN